MWYLSVLFSGTLKHSSNWIPASNSALPLFKIPYLNRPFSTLLFSFFFLKIRCPRENDLCSSSTMSQLFSSQLFSLEQCTDLKRGIMPSNFNVFQKFIQVTSNERVHITILQSCSGFLREIKTYCITTFFFKGIRKDCIV